MHLAIVGAGFSGIALLHQLIEQRAPLSRVSLIGSAADFGRGRAYACAKDLHLLNVRAADMGCPRMRSAISPTGWAWPAAPATASSRAATMATTCASAPNRRWRVRPSRSSGSPPPRPR